MTLKILINLPDKKTECCPVCGALQSEIPLAQTLGGGNYNWTCRSCGCDIKICICPPPCKGEAETVVVDE